MGDQTSKRTWPQARPALQVQAAPHVSSRDLTPGHHSQKSRLWPQEDAAPLPPAEAPLPRASTGSKGKDVVDTSLGPRSSTPASPAVLPGTLSTACWLSLLYAHEIVTN